MQDHPLICIDNNPDTEGVYVAAEEVRSIFETTVKLLGGYSETMQQVGQVLTMLNDRMEALERTVKRRLPVTSTQVRYMNEAIRKRTHALLDGKDGIDAQAYAKLGRIIRRDVLVSCGAASLREIPDHEYSASMDQIGMWNNVLALRDVVLEARERVETLEAAEQAAGMDGE